MPVRHVVLLIGDGMGPQQVGLLLEYARRATQSAYSGEPAAMERAMRQGTMGWVRTFVAESLVADSAAAASQLALGRPSAQESIGLDLDGQPADSILEQARAAGMATGLISDTRLTHATPAAFAAHEPHRSREAEIALDLLETQPDVMLSGGLRYFLPASVATDRRLQAELRAWGVPETVALSSSRRDERHLLREARKAGYHLVWDAAGLATAPPEGRLLGLFAASGMHNAIRHARGAAGQPSLREMTLAAIERLWGHPQGSFLMVEAGQIDWAGHANDAGWLLHEMLRMDAVVDALLAAMADRDDVLLLITADHETGGFGFSYSRHEIPATRPDATSPTGVLPNFNFGHVGQLDALHRQTQTFQELFRAFAAQPSAAQTSEALIGAVAETTGLRIGAEAAAAVLATKPNRTRIPGHHYLDHATVPKLCDFADFYVYRNEMRPALLGRALASQQNVVWSTGTHTATPVPVVAVGPATAAARFNGVHTLSEVGALAAELLLGEAP